MSITIEPQLLATAKPKSGCIKYYRENPSDINAALYAAAHYAKKLGKEMAVFAGNSYMHFIWNIKEPRNVSRVECNGLKLVGYIVKQNGEIYKIAEA